MARVKFSSIISDVNGSVGAVTFQKYSGGSSLRNKPLSLKKATSSQSDSRSFVVQVQRSWASLSASEQSAWSAFLSYSPSFQRNNKKVLLSGFSLFLRYNLLRLHSGLSIVTSFLYSPFSFELPSFDLLIDIGSGDFYFEFSSGVNPAVVGLLLKLTPVLSNPSSSFKNRLRVMRPSAYGVTYTGWQIASSYIASFGALPAIGSKLLFDYTLFSISCPIITSSVQLPVTVLEA